MGAGDGLFSPKSLVFQLSPGDGRGCVRGINMHGFSVSVCTLLLALAGNFAIGPSAQAFPSGGLTVNINGIRNQRGQLCISLFSNSAGFPSQGDRALEAKCMPLGKGVPTITFPNLPPGSYAVAAFHDANRDGTLNRNRLGIPSEGFGFSRNPVIRTGPPKYGDAVVVVAGAAKTIQIRLQYF